MQNNTDWAAMIDLVKGYTPPATKPKAKTKKGKIEAPLKMGFAMDSYDALALNFVYAYQDKVRYSSESKRWLIWNGHIWQWDTVGEIKELVKEFGREYTLAPIEAYKTWGKKILEPTGINKLLEMAQTDPRIAIRLEDMDSEIFEVNTPGGIVDLWTGELTSPDPYSLNKRSTTVTPDSSMPTPKYDTFMAQTFAGEPELSEYVETMIGISLIKSQHEQVFMYLYGAAGSGKGTLMNLVQEIIGKGDQGYSQYVDSEMFVQKKSQPHPTELMQFLGARLVVTSEVSQGQKMDTGKLKKTTGGDNITGRYMQKDFVTFAPTHTLWLMANDKLEVPHDDKGVWRRLRVVPFIHAKEAGDFTAHLYQIIHEEEGAGVLAKWIERATVALTQGFYTPESVAKANNEYIQDQDTLATWMEFCCDTNDSKSFTSGKALRDSYYSWCKTEQITGLGTKTFTQALGKKGYVVVSKEVDGVTTRGFQGIRLTDYITLSSKY